MDQTRRDWTRYCTKYWTRLVDIDDDKDPVGDGEGGIDDGDEEEVEVLDLLLGLPHPHALHQLGDLGHSCTVLLVHYVQSSSPSTRG